MSYDTAQDIINDILFRAGEIPGSSEWDQKVIDYLNRNYLAICACATEYLVEEGIDDWWWLRQRGIITMQPTYSSNAVGVTKGSTSLTFTVAPTIALAGYKIKMTDFPDVYTITSHGAGSVSATIDSPYNGDTNTGAAYQAMKLSYTLDTAVSAIMSPITSFRENPQISGMAPERMDTQFPLGRLQPGVPQAFCLETETSIRFSHGGMTDGRSMRMEYEFRPVVSDLANNTMSIPLIPKQFRGVLSDATLVQVFSDKNDDRMTVVAASTKAWLTAMVRENKRRMPKMDILAAQIVTRPTQTYAHQTRMLRTDSGLLIGPYN